LLEFTSKEMVEGPGCKLKGEKMKGTITGQKVKGVSGNVIDNRPKKDVGSMTPYHLLLGHHVIDVKTLGKELFLIFDHLSCLRVHFLMAGFVRYNHAQSDPDESARKKEVEKPRLELELSKDIVSFYQCSTELRNTEETLARWERMITLDICWKMFDSVRAIDTIMETKNRERMVCDVIMDQEILPGVGNIIKNEACFDASINPLSKIKDLTRAHIAHLVKMNRDFSAIFYNCRKYGKPLHKHYKMYRFSVCKQCQTKVTKCHPGEYERGTYFCSKCQNNDLNAGAKKNSILGWAKTGNSPQKSWSCSACTLDNKPGSPACVACGTLKDGSFGQKRKLSDDNDHGPCKREKNDGSTDSANRLETSTTKLVTTQISQGGFNFKFKSAPIMENKKKVKSEQKDFQFKSGKSTSDKSELCKGHKVPCVKKTVSKEGPNKLRLFWACSLAKGKSCNHFSWADLDHPKCKHGVVTILREVYKLNDNNGREFFVCAKAKGSKDQCDFFQWKD